MFASNQFAARQFNARHFALTGATPDQSLIQTPEEARQNWCFMTGVRPNIVEQIINTQDVVSHNRCVAQRCQAWDWATTDFTKGFCGARGAPVLLFARAQDQRQGRRALNPAQTQMTLWSGPTNIYPFQDTATTLEIVSTNIADTQTVEVTVLSGDFTESTVSATLSGTTPVALSGGPYTAVNDFRIVSPAGATAAGDISCRIPGPGAVLGWIPTGETNQQAAVYTVPKGFEAAASTWAVDVVETTGTAGAAEARLVSQAPGQADYTIDFADLLNFGANPEWQQSLAELWLSAGTRLSIKGQETTTETDVTMSGRFTLEIRQTVQ